MLPTFRIFLHRTNNLVVRRCSTFINYSSSFSTARSTWILQYSRVLPVKRRASYLGDSSYWSLLTSVCLVFPWFQNLTRRWGRWNKKRKRGCSSARARQKRRRRWIRVSFFFVTDVFLPRSAKPLSHTPHSFLQVESNFFLASSRRYHHI